MSDLVRDEDGVLTAPHVLEYPYRRSVGPVLGRFFTALRDGKLVGVKTAKGRVLVPPAEYDPETGEAVDRLVRRRRPGRRRHDLVVGVAPAREAAARSPLRVGADPARRRRHRDAARRRRGRARRA